MEGSVTVPLYIFSDLTLTQYFHTLYENHTFVFIIVSHLVFLMIESKDIKKFYKVHEVDIITVDFICFLLKSVILGDPLGSLQ